jgi:Type II CAAX prenyl endopeptidase Rce1-like
MPSSLAAYGKATRAPRYSLTFALPLLLLYELLAFALSHDAMTGVRNGADVLLKSVFLALGGRRGLIAFGVLLVGGGAVLVWRDLRRSGWRLRVSYFLGMLAESVVYALVFGTVTGLLTSLVLGGIPLLAAAAGPSAAPMARLDLPTQLMISLGAGLYEELLFRVLLVAALARLARGGFGWPPAAAGGFATLVGALVFSAFHYVGPYGDPFELGSFTFRAIAGVLFSALYLLRGFGIAAWTHALYDVFLTVAG